MSRGNRQQALRLGSGQAIGNSKKKSVLGVMLFALMFAFHGSAAALQSPERPRVGLLRAGKAENDRVAAFRRGLRELGYIEGNNLFIENRYADGKFSLLPTLASELVSLKVDVIVTFGGMDTRAAQKATNTIPIVMVQDPDPVASGFVASLARPGGNITGLSRLTPEIGGKRLEILKEIVPKLLRVAVIGTSTNPINAQSHTELEPAARAHALALHSLDVLGPKDIEPAFRKAANGRADAVLVLPSPVFHPSRQTFANLAVKYRMPAIYDRRAFVEAGGLISYGTNVEDLARRAAVYVDKILKGAKPAELPIERPISFELAINLKSAKQIGVTIPPDVLVRATEVIR